MKKSAVFIVLAAGAVSSVHAVDEQIYYTQGRLISPSQTGPIKHVFYHIGTGETIISSVTNGQTVGTDTGSSELIWSVDLMTHQCEGINGFTGISAIGLGDDIGDTDPFAVGATWQSRGGIAIDTVVDCIGFNYWTTHADVDEDGDGNGDGIPGFGIVLDWWDMDDGTIHGHCIRSPLIQLTFGNLEGALDLEPGLFAGFQFTVDLTSANDGESLTMEIGDSDGDPQGAAVSNGTAGAGRPYPVGEPGHDFDLDGREDNDTDGDGFFDWTRSMRFIQPGTFDFDGDGTLDGDIADQSDTAIGMGKPAGYTFVQDPKTGVWEWEIDLDAPAVATGVRQYSTIFYPPNPITGELVHSGFYTNFAGFDPKTGAILPASCDAGAFVPAAVIAHDLYTPGEIPPCLADFDGSGTLDFFDVSAFLDAFASGGDFNNDGLTDFFDVSEFLNAFAAGCP